MKSERADGNAFDLHQCSRRSRSYSLVMRSFLVLVCLSLLAPHAMADPVTRGYGLLKANCARCHAIGRDGDSPHREAPPFRAVMKSYPASSLAEALGEGLITGHPDMPEFSFPPEDVGAIVSYLQTLEDLK